MSRLVDQLGHAHDWHLTISGDVRCRCGHTTEEVDGHARHLIETTEQAVRQQVAQDLLDHGLTEAARIAEKGPRP